MISGEDINKKEVDILKNFEIYSTKKNIIIQCLI